MGEHLLALQKAAAHQVEIAQRNGRRGGRVEVGDSFRQRHQVEVVGVVRVAALARVEGEAGDARRLGWRRKLLEVKEGEKWDEIAVTGATSQFRSRQTGSDRRLQLREQLLQLQHQRQRS